MNVICMHEVCKLHYFISDTIYITLQYVYVVCCIIMRGVRGLLFGGVGSGGCAGGGV